MNEQSRISRYLGRAHEKANAMAIASLGKLFGLHPTKVSESKVLEVGCGTGANVISMALLYPEAKFKGVDESEGAIEDARGVAKELGIKNVRFQHASIKNYREKSSYDYVIIPAIYSWMSEDNRDRLFGKIGAALAENGLAFVSYNTFPGWNMGKTVREMMLFHTRQFDDKATKILEARKMLNFVLANNKEKESPYSKALEAEVNLVTKLEDIDFEREYLSEISEPTYFGDFMNAANRHGLKYVGDMDSEFMYLGNYDEVARSQLGQITTAVHQEQYMDFITNRRVRNTVLTKSGEVNRSINSERLEDFRFRLKLLPTKAIDEATYEEDAVQLASPMNKAITATVGGRERIAFIDYMASAFPSALGIKDIANGAATLAKTPAEEMKERLQKFLVGAVASGLCLAVCEPDLFVREPSEQPVFFGFAKFQSAGQTKINNVRHQTVQISAVDQMLVPLLDGSNGRDKLVTHIQKCIEDGSLNISIEGVDSEGNVPDHALVVRSLIEERLKFYAVNALLVA